MKEVLRTTDPSAIPAALAYLRAEDIEAFVFDVHMSILEGSIGILPRRVMVADDDYDDARRILRLAGVLEPDEG